MSISYSTRYLWHFEGRDRAITGAVLGGMAPARVAQVHGLSTARVMLIVRKTCTRLRPDWVDRGGYPYAWSLPLTRLRAVRGTFGV